jgi:hypothetical protein
MSVDRIQRSVNLFTMKDATLKVQTDVSPRGACRTSREARLIEEFEAARARSLPRRMRYAFVRTYKPVLTMRRSAHSIQWPIIANGAKLNFLVVRLWARLNTAMRRTCTRRYRTAAYVIYS